MSAISDEARPRRRKLRKGTHSCWECKRRKVKCIFASPDDALCITCNRRGAKCVSQVDSDGFEAVASSRVRATDEERRDHAQDSLLSPATTLPGNHQPTPTSIRESTTHASITRELLGAVPSREEIALLLKHVSRFSLLFYQSNYRSLERSPHAYAMLEEGLPTRTLLDPEPHPILLARQMLLLAIALQYLPADEAIPGLLSKTPRLIMEDLAGTAIRAVNMNDALLGTLEGVENLILEELYHVDCGNMRRAWTTTRRAVMAAQLLGIHRGAGHHRFKLLSKDSRLDPDVMWSLIVGTERVLSLLLGLPSSTTHEPTSFVPPATPDGQGSLCHILVFMTAKVLERNQTADPAQARALTAQIDAQLLALTASMTPSTWDPPAFSTLLTTDGGPDSPAAVFEIRRAMDHMCYHTVVNQLHLPYLLRADTPQSRYSRLACATASREVLSREVAIRTFSPAATCGRMNEFVALIAGMTLVLAHLVGYSSSSSSSSQGHLAAAVAEDPVGDLLAHQRLGDRALVERGLECMKSMSELRDDAIAAKCAVLLRDLLAVEADAARYRHGGSSSEEGKTEALVINVPYLGVVTISRQGSLTVTPFNKTAAMPQEQQQDDDHQALLEGITIGGIGSVHIKSSPRASDRAGEMTGPPAAASSTSIASLQTPFGDVFAQQQSDMFPDAAAGVDDWVLQGFDTAFFDTLMQSGGGDGLGFDGLL